MARNKMAKKSGKITKSTKFHDIFDSEGSREILEERGMHCLGCPLASFETIEQGARAHGLDADELVRELNKKKRRK